MERSISNLLLKPQDFLRELVGLLGLILGALLLLIVIVITPRRPRPGRPHLYLLLRVNGLEFIIIFNKFLLFLALLLLLWFRIVIAFVV